MTFDPFADEPTTDVAETVTEPATDVWDDAPAAASNDKKETTVVVNAQNEGKLTITLKGGAGFDAPWIVIHAQDAADGLEQMKDPALKELMNIVKSAGSHFSGGSGNATQRPAQQAQGGARPPQQSAPSGETKTCQHGEMVFKSGVSKSSGKPYKGFFCPSNDRNAQCKPEFIR